jgi:hypothetical protein
VVAFIADEALELLRRTILNRVDPVTPLRIEFANRVNYVVRVRPR